MEAALFDRVSFLRFAGQSLEDKILTTARSGGAGDVDKGWLDRAAVW
jgi:hypothetical protein